MKKLEIRTVDVVQYVKPLREGGSLPAIVNGSDDFPYVLKFRGAGQGTKALIAEFLGGELARTLGLKVPELVFMNLDDSFSKTEGDEEIQDLLRFSVGLNLGLHFLSGTLPFDPLVSQVDGLVASKVVLLDSIISNIDRTAKNTNLLMWHRELWLIDHGASFYFHHHWPSWESHLSRTFPKVQEHVLLSRADQIDLAAAFIKQTINEAMVQEIVSHIPEDWLEETGAEIDSQTKRDAYAKFIMTRIGNLDLLAKEALDAK